MSDAFPRFTADLLRKQIELPAHEAFLRGGWQGVAEFIFENSGSTPSYSREGTATFEEERTRLNTEPGFLIANHPGSLDGALLMNTLDRSDVKILVAEAFVDSYRRILGDQFVLPATRNPDDLIPLVRKILNHIEAGGLFVLFPTGGDRASKPFAFGGLFGFLLRRLPPELMVYAMAIDPRYPTYLNLRSVPGQASVVSRLFVPSALQGTPAPIAVDERYTQIQDWPAQETALARRNQHLTEHYLHLFPEVF